MTESISELSTHDALQEIARSNHYSADMSAALEETFKRMWRQMPADVQTKCSLRLREGTRKGRFMSINIMNYLLYRAPAYTDQGGAPKWDSYLILDNTIRQEFARFKRMFSFPFKLIDCDCYGLSFRQILDLGEDEWRYFSQACTIAANARRTRSWSSNVQRPNSSWFA